MFACDFVQAPPRGDPNHGSLLGTEKAGTAKQAISEAALLAIKAAKPGRIHGMVYTDDAVLASHTGNSVEEVRQELLGAVS